MLNLYHLIGKDEFTLQELAALSGVEARTIRSYFEQGLLRGADRTGRGARYTKYHLDRLKAIRLLRSANRSVPLPKIRVLLQQLSDEQVESIASGRAVVGALIDTDDDSQGMLSSPSTESESSSFTACSISRAQYSLGRPDAVAPDAKRPLEKILDGLKEVVGRKRVPATTRSEVWHEIEVTPDIRLSVRGAYQAEEMAQFQEIADHLRDLLLGGSSDDNPAQKHPDDQEK